MNQESYWPPLNQECTNSFEVTESQSCDIDVAQFPCNNFNIVDSKLKTVQQVCIMMTKVNEPP